LKTITNKTKEKIYVLSIIFNQSSSHLHLQSTPEIKRILPIYLWKNRIY